jgi:hypothetical protein
MGLPLKGLCTMHKLQHGAPCLMMPFLLPRVVPGGTGGAAHLYTGLQELQEGGAGRCCGHT